MVKIAMSILSADFAKLGEEVESIPSAEYIHFDVMDGVFVPNISVGLPVLRSLRRVTDKPIDVHLMIQNPIKYTQAFLDAGADIIVFHIESDEIQNILAAVDIVKKSGKKAGITLRPGTPLEAVIPHLGIMDTVLIMAVEPGFGGQKFMPQQADRIARLRQIIDSNGYECEIFVDGGINEETAKICVAAGVDVLVAGNSLFTAEDRDAYADKLRGMA